MIQNGDFYPSKEKERVFHIRTFHVSAALKEPLQLTLDTCRKIIKTRDLSSSPITIQYSVRTKVVVNLIP